MENVPFHLRKMCILLLGAMFCRCLSPFVLRCSISTFLVNFLFGRSIYCCDNGVLQSPTMTVLLSLSPLSSVINCLIYFGVQVLEAYIFMIFLDVLAPYHCIMTFFVIFQSFWLEVYIFVPYKYGYTGLLFVSICLEHHLSFFHFEPMCICRAEISLL